MINVLKNFLFILKSLHYNVFTVYLGLTKLM